MIAPRIDFLVREMGRAPDDTAPAPQQLEKALRAYETHEGRVLTMSERFDLVAEAMVHLTQLEAKRADGHAPSASRRGLLPNGCGG